MKYRFLVIILLFITGLVLISCDSVEEGESYLNLPTGPKVMFRGGFGKITIRYFPPPPPVFKVAQATQYLEFKEIKNRYGIPDKPLIVEYLVQTSVMSAIVTQRTANSQFNDYAIKTIQSWMYTRFGKGALRVKIDVAKRKIWVDASDIGLIEPEPGKPQPSVASGRQLVKCTGFTVHSGEI